MKKKCLVVAAVVVSLISFAGACYAEKAAAKNFGEELFKQHCAGCHPDGGNIIDPKYTLHKKDLKAHRITKPADIVTIMRNPGPGMTKFDKKTIPDKDAQRIAGYILKTFK
jgi:cytochrome c6